jgi:hypothetical protein
MATNLLEMGQGHAGFWGVFVSELSWQPANLKKAIKIQMGVGLLDKRI